MRVVIVNPEARSTSYGPLKDLAAIEIPVWAGLIADYLILRGVDVQILDCEVDGLDAETAAKKIRELQPDLAVFTVYGQQPSASTQCLPAAEDIARRCGVRTICVGTHPSALPARTLAEGPWTYVAEGEGHRTVIGLLHALDGMWQIKDVPGLWWKNGGQIVSNLKAKFTQNLDSELGSRGLKLFDFKKYRAHNWHAFGFPSASPYASLQTSLGCPFRCTFCCINAPFSGASIRHWSADNVLGAMDYLAKQGVKHIKIPDEMFLLNSEYYEAICDGILERGYDFNIWAYARVDTVKDRHLEKLKRAGFNWLGIGIESASKNVRDGSIKGKFDDGDIFHTVRAIQKSGIAVGANYIFGLPDDTHESMKHTLDMALELNTEWANFYSAMAYPGSQLHKTARQNGWALPEDGPGWAGYAQHGYECLPLPTQTLSAREVLAFRDAAHKAYFERPEYLKLIGKKFGAFAVADVLRMNKHSLKRALLTEKEAA